MDAVFAAHRKLAGYYLRTDNAKGLLHNLACVLDPTRKLDLYESDTFEAKNAKIYKTAVRNYYVSHYDHMDRYVVGTATTDSAVSMDWHRHLSYIGKAVPVATHFRIFFM